MSLNSVKMRSRCCGLSKKPCCLQEFVELAKASPRSSSILDTDRVLDQLVEFADFLFDLLGIPGEADGSDHVFQPLALGILHLVQFFHVGQVGRGEPGNLLRLLQHLCQSLGAILKRAPERICARRQSTLIQRHQESDGPGTRVIAVCRCPVRLRFYESGHFSIKFVLGAVDVEVHRVSGCAS